MSRRTSQLQRYSDLCWALSHGAESRDLVPMLEQLLKVSPEPGEIRRFAERHLAEQLLLKAPFRSARLARGLAQGGDDPEAWSLYGMALARVGCFQEALKAYRQAWRFAPHHPGHSHNLGHLLDVAMDRPSDGLEYLEAAYAAEPNVPDLASSLAHALARTGQGARALALLTQTHPMSREQAGTLIARWLAAAAPLAAQEPAQSLPQDLPPNEAET